MAGLTKVIDLLDASGALQAPSPPAERFVDLQYLKEAGLQKTARNRAGTKRQPWISGNRRACPSPQPCVDQLVERRNHKNSPYACSEIANLFAEVGDSRLRSGIAFEEQRLHQQEHRKSAHEEHKGFEQGERLSVAGLLGGGFDAAEA